MKSLFFILCCFLMLQSFSQEYYIAGAAYKYFLGDTQPDVDWKSVDFDDSSWEDGLFSISFGYGEDTTIVKKTNTFYLRYTFDIDADTVSVMQLLANFDDGFIAYLNGNEIVRVNLGRIGDEKAYDDTTDRSREAYNSNFFYTMNYCNPAFAYYIDTTKVSNYLQTGKNVLSIEVHNDSIGGSDLKFQTYLLDVTHSSYNVYSPVWKGIQQIDLDSTHLPIVKIETDEYRFTKCKEWIDGYMTIIDNGNESYNKLSDTTFDYNGYIGIKTKGESSADWTKGNYNIETRDETGENLNVNILGMGKENDWVLFGPFADRSQIRNELIYTLSNDIGLWAPKTRYCELIINGEYYGLYQIIEKIKKDDDRVDIKTLTDIDNEGVHVSGGYIIKYDKGSANFQMVYPKVEDITQEQYTYISEFFNSYRYSTYDSVLFNPERGYRNYVDIPSYLDYTILNELCKNPDAYRYSFYMHKDRDDVNDKLQFGPVWDYDLAFGNSTFQDAKSPYGWQFDNKYTNALMRHLMIFKDSTLVEELQERWEYLRTGKLHMDTLINLIDSKVSYLGNAITRNFTVWPLEGRKMNIFGFNFSSNYDEEIENLKAWLTNRIEWMDEEIYNIYYPYTYKPEQYTNVNTWEDNSQCTVYPNPFYKQVILSYYLEESSNISIVITDMKGTPVYNFEQFIDETGIMVQQLQLEYLTKGVYMLQAKIGDKNIFTEKLIKN